MILNSMVLGSVYVLMAVGLTLIYGVLKILHIAHAGVYTLGALIALWIFEKTGNITIAFILSLILSGMVGVLMYSGIYRKVLKKSRIVPLVISIGMFVALQDLFRLIWGPYKKSFQVDLGIPEIITEDMVVTQSQILILIVTAISLLVMYFLMVKTKWGKALRACSDDLDMTASLGVNIERTISFGFFFGSVLAALAGILVGIYDNSVYPTMGEVPSYKAFIVIVLGGFGSLRGAVLAGFILAFAENFLVAWKGFLLPRDAIAFLIMIAILMFKPEGLFGGISR